MYSDKCLQLFPTFKQPGPPPEPLFKTFLFTRSCSVPRKWSCLCLCHKFRVPCGGGGKKCSCWTAAKENAGKITLEDADNHWGRNCECQQRVRTWEKNLKDVSGRGLTNPWTSITNSML